MQSSDSDFSGLYRQFEVMQPLQPLDSMTLSSYV